MITIERMIARGAEMDAEYAELTGVLRRQRQRGLANIEEDLDTERNPYVREVLEQSAAGLREDLARMDRAEADWLARTSRYRREQESWLAARRSAED